MPVRMLALLLALGCCSNVFAGADKKCNGDAPVRRCSATILRGSVGVGPEPASCAAFTWRIGRVETDAQGNPGRFIEDKRYAEIVEPSGKWVPEYAAVEAELCWEVTAIRAKEERPEDLRDTREKVQLTCKQNPKDISVILPQLVDVGRLSIDPEKRELVFFGMPTMLIKHSGSRYLGITADFAVTIHKTTGEYKIVLPNGGSFSGSCTYSAS